MGLLAVAAHAFDAWCITRVGVTAASSSMLLIASLASGTITQVRHHVRAVADAGVCRWQCGKRKHRMGFLLHPIRS